MYKISNIIILVCLILMESCALKKPLSNSKNKYHLPTNFPIDWIGDYHGHLNIHNVNGSIDTISMRLLIEYPDSEGFFPWTIVYNKSDVRKYGLEVINTDRKQYRINEYNSIEFDAFLIDQHLISRFSLLQNDLIIDYEYVGDAIIVQFYITGTQSINITGGEIIGQDTVPKVSTYPISVYQKAILKKKD